MATPYTKTADTIPTSQRKHQLSELIDIPQIQSFLDDLHQLTNIGGAIQDLDGTLLISTGMQDICSRFHRAHPEAGKRCAESDMILSKGLRDNSYRLCKCKNNIWQIVSPIFIDKRHVGNIFVGQFFFEDDEIDYGIFREQARRYGFDEAEYFAALDRVPKWSAKKASTVMSLYRKFIKILFSESYGSANITKARQESEQLIKTISNNLTSGMIFQLIRQDDQRRQFTYLSNAVKRLHGVSPEEGLANPGVIYGQMIPEDIERLHREEEQAYASMSTLKTEVCFIDAAGNRRWSIITSTPTLLENGTTCWDGLELDITETKRAEEAQEILRAQLLQSQKMESIGRLAGGVAHDFNNMLSVILGRAELVLAGLDPKDPLFGDIEEIRKAAQRSADLTRQLLAFARKQTVAPKVLDLNETISGMLTMLQRLIGEHIALEWEPCADLWSVKIDPAQAHQVLVNLCVNARDAIASTGTISIATQNITINRSSRAYQSDIAPGAYVALTIKDNGYGMTQETLLHLFEPFFTTKDVGQGTGLGLATVYGIVKQNGGNIRVDSEPGKGAAFTIYLPRLGFASAERKPVDTKEPPKGFGETILIVEDEENVLALSRSILTKLGYRVITAATPSEAISKFLEYKDAIDIVITDVLMPEMSGLVLAERLQEIHPKLKCLFMSGYAYNTISPNETLDEDIDFIQKPFSIAAFGAKVREVLDRN
jgi:signal transduction histidine kinase/CheY-like chemotaxis protein/ligand-binding sensor protein